MDLSRIVAYKQLWSENLIDRGTQITRSALQPLFPSSHGYEKNSQGGRISGDLFTSLFGVKNCPTNGGKLTKLNGRRYTFSYRERSIEIFTMGIFEIMVEDQKVFECHVHVHFEDELETTYTPGDIQTFIEEEWVEELKNLLSLILEHQAERLSLSEKERRENPEKLMELKKRFGIK